MKVAIGGAGAVGRSIARELIESRHEVTLLERNPDHIDPEAVPEAQWRLGDACEISLLEAEELHTFDVVIAATGDDKANLVLSLLAKTEFAVARVVARVNDPAMSGCSTTRGASMSRCRHRACWPPLSKRRSPSVTWCGSWSSARDRPIWWRSPCPTTPPGAVNRYVSWNYPVTRCWWRFCAAHASSPPSPTSPFEGGDELILVATADIEDELHRAVLPE